MATSNNSITILDYGVGNILSVKRAFEHVGCQVTIEEKPSKCIQADRIVLPGVGAFGDCANTLKLIGFWDEIKRFKDTQRPILGICVGMQLMFQSSKEFGHHEGFRFLDGQVEAMPTQFKTSKESLRVPQIGWAPVNSSNNSKLLSKEQKLPEMYFVHSYCALTNNTNYTISTYQHGDHSICAAVEYENIYATQFHPEKSAKAGLSVLKQFSEI
jgi:glutamine amidotransferase